MHRFSLKFCLISTRLQKMCRKILITVHRLASSPLKPCSRSLASKLDTASLILPPLKTSPYFFIYIWQVYCLQVKMSISHDGSFFLPPPPTTVNGLLQECFPSPNPNPNPDPNSSSSSTNNKRKRNSSRELDSETMEVVALSPKSLMATYRFICEICNKGFQRDQNLQLHRRGHNLPWKLKQRNNTELVKKKVYVCPEVSCVHHEPLRALGDLTGIKKHFSRKHGEKKWKCPKCPKKYAVMSDLKAHTKICGTREYKCDCGTIFSRKDSFITHRAFCETLTEERMRNITTNITPNSLNSHSRPDLIIGSLMSTVPQSTTSSFFPFPTSHRLDFVGFDPSSNNGSNSMGAHCGLVNKPRLPMWLDHHHQIIPQAMNNHINNGVSRNLNLFASPPSSSQPIAQHTMLLKEEEDTNRPSFCPENLKSLYSSSPGTISVTTLLQKTAQMGSTRSNVDNNPNPGMYFNNGGTDDLQHHQRDLLRQHMNHQLAVELTGIGSGLSGDGYENGSRQQGHNNTSSMSIGMRDFLGGLGGGNGGEQGERRVIMQEEMGYSKFATMDNHHHQEEPYMDFMG